jgi:purine-binding chemotaxis protein CheW
MGVEKSSGRRADWHALKLRLAAVKAELGREASPEEFRQKIQAILTARAAAIAEPEAAEYAGEAVFDVLEFRLGRETYAIETAAILEVHALKDYTPIPCAPSFVLGILNVRGRIFSVLDIRKFFALAAEGITELNKAILLKWEGMEFGILADSVLSVRRLLISDCLPPLATHTGIREKYLKGVTGKGVIVLDAVKLLSDPAVVVREQVDPENARADGNGRMAISSKEDTL